MSPNYLAFPHDLAHNFLFSFLFSLSLALSLIRSLPLSLIRSLPCSSSLFLPLSLCLSGIPLEREDSVFWVSCAAWGVYEVCIYIYIYTWWGVYICMCTYVYTYIYIYSCLEAPLRLESIFIHWPSSLYYERTHGTVDEYSIHGIHPLYHVYITMILWIPLYEWGMILWRPL